MRLEGSCHCGAIRFSLDSRTYYPFMRCYCSVCRKTAGGGGYASNLMGSAEGFEVTGKENLSVYQAMVPDKNNPANRIQSPARRHFCQICGSALYLLDPRWPKWVYPLASAINTPLPIPPQRTHIFTADKPSWVEIPQ
ncbi:MAG: GFA family protein, partial [Deltaproteobacteria bacterium]|nr:GFA family protein [Deltaproteobacteria bacterium]